MLMLMSKCPDSGVVDVLNQELKAVIGLINGFKKKIQGYVTTVQFLVMGNHLTSLACLWPSQIKKLSYYDDLVFIDSTFNVTSDDYKGLSLVIVCQHFKSLVGAFAFTSVRWLRCVILSWTSLVSMFTFKRLPLCLASVLHHKCT